MDTLPGKRPLIRRAFRPPNYETPLRDLIAPFTANDAFFVRYHLAVIPQVNPRSWRLAVGGTSAGHALSLSLRDLRENFEPVTIAAVNQCSGNRRGLFTPRVPGVQWGNGAMGNARWSGVRLRDVLERAGRRQRTRSRSGSRVPMAPCCRRPRAFRRAYPSSARSMRTP